MSRSRIPRRGYPKDASGNPLCRVCRKPVKPPRRSFCSEACSDKHGLDVRPGDQRDAIWKRDRGVCRGCGVDTNQIRDALVYILRPFPTQHAIRTWRMLPHAGVRPSDAPGKWYATRATLTHQFFEPWWARTRWEMDHVVEMWAVGGEFIPGNLQTLCLACHRRKTARFAALRARLRAMGRGLLHTCRILKRPEPRAIPESEIM